MKKPSNSKKKKTNKKKKKRAKREKKFDKPGAESYISIWNRLK